MMGMYGSGMGAGGWLAMGLFWIALIALIVWLVIRVLPSRGAADHSTVVSSSAASGLKAPFEILDRRLAQGDIDSETYQAHRSALTAARARN